MNPKIFLFSKRNCLFGAILKVSQQMVNTRWMFPTKGRISLSKNSVFQRNEEFWTEIFYELKNSSYFYTHKYLHYVLYSFSWQGFAFCLLLPKTSFCLKIVDECKHPRIQAIGCYSTQNNIVLTPQVCIKLWTILAAKLSYKALI